jgi:sulfatase modifying factor 1
MRSMTDAASEKTGTQVRIADSRFLLGTPERVLDWIASQQQYDRSWFEDESPQHEVALDAFFIDVHPVSNAEFREFALDTGYRSVAEQRGFGLIYSDYWREVAGAHWRAPCGPGTETAERDAHPVVHIALEDAKAYACWAGKRLPSEPEWELAARGVDFRIWPWGDVFCPDAANTAELSASEAIEDLAGWRRWWQEFSANHELPGTTERGCFETTGASPYGVCDMAGNVLEWTGSRYSKYDPQREYDPTFEAAAGRYAAMRGGSWMHLRYQVRCSERLAGATTGYSSFATGFRCARDAPSGQCEELALQGGD